MDKTSCWELALKRKKQCSLSSKEELESLPLLVELVMCLLMGKLWNQLLVDSYYDHFFVINVFCLFQAFPAPTLN